MLLDETSVLANTKNDEGCRNCLHYRALTAGLQINVDLDSGQIVSRYWHCFGSRKHATTHPCSVANVDSRDGSFTLPHVICTPLTINGPLGIDLHVSKVRGSALDSANRCALPDCIWLDGAMLR
jgi:hypothetical protein